MSHTHSSLQSQSPLSEAQDSVEKLQRAVAQATSHPAGDMISQAYHALARAERAVKDAQSDGNQTAVAKVSEGLQSARATLQQLQ